MKQLTKETLCRFEKNFRILSTNEMRSLIGGDKYIFNASGQITEIIPESGKHIVYANGDNSGFELGQYTNISSGIVGEGNRQGVLISGASFDLFEYFAQRTNVEWGLSYDSRNNEDEFKGTLSTNCNASEIDPVFCKGDDSYTHSHPGNTPEPSPKDQGVADNMLNNKEYNYKYFEIYTPGNSNTNLIKPGF